MVDVNIGILKVLIFCFLSDLPRADGLKLAEGSSALAERSASGAEQRSQF